METAFIAGIFAFLGAIAGQILNRNTQRETWLLQKRAEVFSQFLLDFDEFDRVSSKLRDRTFKSDVDNDTLNLALDKFNTSENIVCFYLSESDKTEFRNLVSERRYFEIDYDKLTDKNDPKQYQELVEPWHEINDKIQNLFQRNLEQISWYS